MFPLTTHSLLFNNCRRHSLKHGIYYYAKKYGYMYTCHKTLSQGVTSWELRRHGNCNARVKLSATDTSVEAVNEHSHASSSIK